MKVRVPAWTLAMASVVAEVQHLEDGPIRGYDGDQPRVRLTWGQGRKPWSQIEHADFLESCEVIS